MRTTVRLDEELLRRAKRRALESGRTLTALIEEGLRSVLARPAPGESREIPDLPVSGSGGILPGVDLDDTAALYDIMEGDR